MNLLKIGLSSLALGMLLTLSMSLTQITSAHGPGDWKPDNVWTGPLPEVCIDVYDPVHDVFGNTYSNECYAALDGVRVTWDGEGHSLKGAGRATFFCAYARSVCFATTE